MPNPFTEDQTTTLLNSAMRPVRARPLYRVEHAISNINWLHLAFKICAYSYVAFVTWTIWQIFRVPSDRRPHRPSDRITTTDQDLTNYFGSFRGFSDCGITAHELYSGPSLDRNKGVTTPKYCSSRSTLLESLSNGGRIGFDAHYTPRGCQYRWYSTAEICMILERFERLIFVGDGPLQSIYSALNIFVRQDLANGALQTWAMKPSELVDCQCDNQFKGTACAQYFVSGAEQVRKDGKHDNELHRNSHHCGRVAHNYINIGAGRPSQSTIDAFTNLVPKTSSSTYKPIPIIISISPSTTTHKDASSTLLEFLKLADLSERKTPMLWIGPAAAGHIEIRGRKSNQEIWDFDGEMAKTARKNDIEVLKMWNMTVQATTWDGVGFGEKVVLVQAMMVMNWLSRLESS